jgi:hypothetical protein
MKNNKGQGMAFLAMELMIGIFIVILVYAVLDDTMKTKILPAGLSTASNATAYNNSMNQIAMGWSAFPWVLIFCSFILLLMVALMQGRQG